MRTMLTAAFDVEAGNKAISDGSLQKIMETVMSKITPEATYFTTTNGERTMYVIFDMKDTSEIPAICEPLFMNLKAKVDIKPVMNQEDLQRGLSAWGASK